MLRYDTDQAITIEGIVNRLDWRNPHVYIYIEQITESGETVEWEIEGHAPIVMHRFGWVKETLAPGEAISVKGNPHREQHIKSILPITITQANKTLLSMAAFFTINNFEKPTQGATSLAGLWATELDLQEVEKYLDPRNFDLTQAWLDAVEAFDEATILPDLECIPAPPPYAMLYPELKKIEIHDEEIIIIGEGENTKRIIHLNANKLMTAEPNLLGNSVGQWQDDTLFIITTDFSPHRNGNGPRGFESSPKKQLKEWLQLTDDGKAIEYRFELTDPTFIKSSINGKARWIYQPTAEFQPATCSTENARKFLR